MFVEGENLDLWHRLGANPMTTANEIHVNSGYLLKQLGNWKCIAAAFCDLFDKDPFQKEFLAFKMDIVQGFIEELQAWEETGNETKCKNAIDNSEFFLGQIQVLIDRVLGVQYQANWEDMEEERNFTFYLHVP